MSHVLIVDDEPTICWGFHQLLAEDGHQVSIASSAEEALDLADRTKPDAVVLDVRLPGRDGLSSIDELRRRIGDVPIIVVTAFGDLSTAVRAVEAGAYDYLPKPFDLDQAAAILRRALSRETTDKTPMPGTADPCGEMLVGSSLPAQALFKQIALAASSDVSVLITGESGTGKELVAKAIHQHSRRRDAAYLPISLAALSPALIEAELFGHVRGAFTGADRDRRGLLELAEGGTVLLDEIGDVPLPVQVKLLRAIEQREFTPVGDSRPRQSDFRILSATNRPLPELVGRGEFREDLYYRLGVFQIHVPSLRERAEDIPLLAQHFLRLAMRGAIPKRLSAAAENELTSRCWRGNIRELRNAIERAAVVARGDQIEAEHLPPATSLLGSSDTSVEEELRQKTAEWVQHCWDATASQDRSDLYGKFLRVVEPMLLESILANCGKNRAAAARALGIHRATLRQKLRDYGAGDE